MNTRFLRGESSFFIELPKAGLASDELVETVSSTLLSPWETSHVFAIKFLSVVNLKGEGRSADFEIDSTIPVSCAFTITI